MDSPQGTAEYFTMQAKSNSSKHGKNQLSTTAALTAAPHSLPPQPLGGAAVRGSQESVSQFRVTLGKGPIK